MKTKQQKQLEALKRAEGYREYWLKIKHNEYSFLAYALSKKDLSYIHNARFWNNEEELKFIDRKIRHHENQIATLLGKI